MYYGTTFNEKMADLLGKEVFAINWPEGLAPVIKKGRIVRLGYEWNSDDGTVDFEKGVFVDLRSTEYANYLGKIADCLHIPLALIALSEAEAEAIVEKMFEKYANALRDEKCAAVNRLYELTAPKEQEAPNGTD